MRYFVCLLDPGEHGVTDAARQAYEKVPSSRGLEFTWGLFDQMAVLTAWDDPWGDPLVAQENGWVAVGVARLDNRGDVEQWVGAKGLGLTDLELLLRAITRIGRQCVPNILGDFALLVRDGASRTVLAATDALGVKRLFHAKRGGLLTFASRAEPLAIGGRYNAQYLAELISGCILSPGLTVYADVHRLPPGSIATLEGREVSVQRYWWPEEAAAQPRQPMSERQAVDTFRQLFAEAVRSRVSDDGTTWAQLSGGLDSSAIVSMAQWLVEHGAMSQGLGGTVTYVDSQNTDADEREYSDLVAGRWGIRNETIIDPPVWFDYDAPPPRLDQPLEFLALYPRERRLCATVRRAGGRSLLAGFGSDELFTGTSMFFADWLARGRLWSTVHELARWAAMGRVSFWELGYRNAILPLIPVALRRPSSVAEGRLLPWISSTAARQYHLRTRTLPMAEKTGRWGSKYRGAVTTSLAALIARLDAGSIGDVLDVRYPFLYRPLVELGLGLPATFCARPHERKWVLREGLRDVLPEPVRRRVGKGAWNDVLVRSLTEKRPLLEPLLDAPILSDLGVVDGGGLRRALEMVPHDNGGDGDLGTDVQNTLMVEAWLQMRAGRWPQGPYNSS